MAIDPYSPCPCGSGKKLKFCCSDLAGEIEKIQRMIEGDQMHAALKHVAQTLAKHPGRASLLDLQAILEMAMGKITEAAATIAVFLQAHPKSSSAWANRALLLTHTEGSQAAAAALQTAFEVADSGMPRRVLEAIGAVGNRLLVEGHLFAGQAHLWLFAAIAGSEDTRAIELLMKLNRESGLPLLLRDSLSLRNWPGDAPWKTRAEEATTLSDRGLWQQAINIVDELGQQHGAEPVLLFNRAVLGGRLGDEKALIAGLYAFATLDVARDDAIEAAAIAQLLDPDIADRMIEKVKIEYAINDLEQLEHILDPNPRVVRQQADSSLWPEEKGAPPRSTYLLLDRPSPESGMDIVRSEVPCVAGVLFVFGRQTDRSEHLDFVVERDSQFEDASSGLAEVLGDVLGDVVSEEKVGVLTESEIALSWKWHFPTDTPSELARKVLAEERSDAIVNRWPDVARAVLGGKTPREAAGDPAIRTSLEALVLILEQGSSNVDHAESIGKLRETLGLPQPEPIVPDSAVFKRIPLVRVPRVDLSKVSDDQLVELYRHAALLDAAAALRAICREILERPSVNDRVSCEEAYTRLLGIEKNPEVALDLICHARRASEEAGTSTANWDIAELELHLMEGRIEDAQRMLREIDERHHDNQEVAATVYSLLIDMGILEMDENAYDSASNQPSSEMVTSGAPSEGATGIWTPGDDAPPGESASKLWTPS